MKRLLTIFFSILFCGQVFAAGNIIDEETYNKISPGNIIYSNKTEALLLKTGQTTSYHAGDDGALELGIAHSFTVLTVGQYSGTTNITINGKTHATSNACVQDNNTGKMWLREVIQADIGPDTDGKLFWEQYTIAAESVTFAEVGGPGTDTITAAAGTPFDTGALCVGRIFTVLGTASNNGTYTVSAIANNIITTTEDLADEGPIATDFATVDDLIWDLKDQANAAALAGYTDWRPPNVRESYSIVSLGYANPSINGTVFPSTPSSYFWTSSTPYGSGTYSFYVLFDYGNIGGSNRQVTKFYVRLVRN